MGKPEKVCRQRFESIAVEIEMGDVGADFRSGFRQNRKSFQRQIDDLAALPQARHQNGVGVGEGVRRRRVLRCKAGKGHQRGNRKKAPINENLLNINNIDLRITVLFLLCF